MAEVGERVTRLEVVAEQTAGTLERLIENGFAKVERDFARVERDAKGNFDKLDAKIDRVRDEVLADNRSNRRLIGWTLFGFSAVVYGTIGLAGWFAL